MNLPAQITLHSTAHYFLEGLNELGVEYLFCNLGTDHAPLIEAMARWRSKGLAHAKTVICPHENVAVHMAAGYAIATGRGQGVLVHVDAGTANAAMALHNLYRARIPVLLMAGKSPHTLHGELPGSRDTYVHFVQEPFDQASLVRPYVKWEYTLPTGVVAKEALRRAHTLMQSDPKGPVYLMLPRETLAESWDASAVRSYPEQRFGPVAAGGADPAAVEALAERLLAARDPVLVTAYAGRNPDSVALLDELARFAGIRVYEFNPLHLSLPHDSPCFAGFMPGSDVAQSDCGVLLDVDVPWIPKDMPDNPQGWWAHIDVDAVKRGFPMWGFPSNLRMEGDSRIILAQLLEALRALATPEFTARARARVEALAAAHRKRTEGMARLAADPGTTGRINPNYLCAELNRALAPEDVVLNEAIRNTLAVFNQVPRSRPGTRIGLAGGGLGFSGGMALGMKLARPECTVVQVVGDGSFYFCNPEAVYAVSAQYKLPIFTLVLDNGGWAAVKEATLRMHPEGDAKRLDAYQSQLAPNMAFAKVAESAGAYGETLTEPSEVAGAIRRCLDEVRGGRSALLHAHIGPH
jgi:acetolactate synthase-1/2/3 large subunit